MRIKILRTVGKKDTQPRSSDNPASMELPAKHDGTMYQEGEVAEFSNEEAERFLKTNMGEQTTAPVGPPPPPPPPVRLVAVQTEGAVPQAAPQVKKNDK